MTNGTSTSEAEISARVEDLVELHTVLEELEEKVWTVKNLCGEVVRKYREDPQSVTWKTLRNTAENIADGCARVHNLEFQLRSKIRTEDPDDFSFYIYQSAQFMEKISRETYGVRVVYDGEKVMAKLPLIEGSKNRAPTHEATAKNLFYRRELRMQVQKLLHEHPELYRFDAQKTIVCVFVRNSVTDWHMPLRDSDNYYTKPITDALTDFLGGDEPLSCDFFYKTIESEKLETGTYILLLWERNRMFSAEEIERNLLGFC